MWDSRIHAEAQQEYEEAVAWYLVRDAGVAARFAQAAFQTLESVASDPERNERIHTSIFVVRIPSFPYQIVYQTYENEFEVLAFAHTARESGYWINRIQS